MGCRRLVEEEFVLLVKMLGTNKRKAMIRYKRSVSYTTTSEWSPSVVCGVVGMDVQWQQIRAKAFCYPAAGLARCGDSSRAYQLRP